MELVQAYIFVAATVLTDDGKTARCVEQGLF